MSRVLIVGSCGAGKSTLARRLGAILVLPVVHLDSLYWRAGWVQTPDDEFDVVLEEALAGQTWIIDGSFSRTLTRRVAAADTIIFLDLPRWLCVYRVFRRYIQYRGHTRPDMGEGCPEPWPNRGFVRWIWNYPTQQRPEVVRLLGEQSAHKKVFHLTSANTVETFLKEVSEKAAAAQIVDTERQEKHD